VRKALNESSTLVVGPNTRGFELTFDLDLNDDQIALFDSKLRLVDRVYPSLVMPNALEAPEKYWRFRNQAGKEKFRDVLLGVLVGRWEMQYGIVQAQRLETSFKKLAISLLMNGAVAFADILSKGGFNNLLESYSTRMGRFSSESFLHSYLNLGKHRSFLEADFNDAFLHPILVAIIAYSIGGPVCLVDARAKDTGPLEARAQDNMLHIDNTPFRDEYKVILLWRKGETKGPAGQNFVFLPGTHLAARNCSVRSNGEAYSTENESVFVTEKSLVGAFEVQEKLYGCESPTVIEVADADRPISVIFAAGSLIHHRHRTLRGYDRSSVILAFHDARDCRVPLFSLDGPSDNLLKYVLSGASSDELAESQFITVVSREASEIGGVLIQLASPNGVEVLSHAKIALGHDSLSSWWKSVVHAPEVSDIRRSHVQLPRGNLSITEFESVLVSELMRFDKHGPLDLILYSDSREETRKWARNRIRESSLTDLQRRLKRWRNQFRSPSIDDVLNNSEVSGHIAWLLGFFSQLPADNSKVEKSLAERSLLQLATDLVECLSRTYDRQNFVSTSLFCFWVFDELAEMRMLHRSEVALRGGKLLRHYVSASVIALRGTD